MKFSLHDIVMLYEEIKRQINIAEVSVVMFTSMDVDALCTLKILSKFLRSENILYNVYPVSTYSELEQRIEDCRALDKIRLFFFINCGALIDLTTKWFSKQSYSFLFDVHKPINHANIEAENVKIIDDEHSGLQSAPTAYEAQIYQNMDDDLIQDMERKVPSQQEQGDDDIIMPKRRRTWNQQTQKIEKIRKYRSLITDKINDYYGNNFFGLPSSYIAYRMIKDLNKANSEYLWYAIVGITGMYIEHKVSRENMESICDIYRSDMSKDNRKGDNIVFIKNFLKNKLDFQFPLMRHWSLYDSILNSPYMISKLQLWQQNGINKLLEFINLVGLSVEEAKQLYKFLSKDSLNKLETEVMITAENQRFKLFDIAFESFSREVDYCVEFMASDYYYAMISVLERVQKQATSISQFLPHRIKCFWEAYKLFDAKQTNLKQAIQEYKNITATISKEAINLIKRNHVMHGKTFSFVNIYGDSPERKVFEHPCTLIRLAYLLMSIFKEKKKSRQYKPFVASLQSKETNTSLMVGVMMDPKNTFGVKFDKVVQKLNLNVTLNSFTGNIMVVPKDSMITVVKELGLMYNQA